MAAHERATEVFIACEAGCSAAGLNSVTGNWNFVTSGCDNEPFNLVTIVCLS